MALGHNARRVYVVFTFQTQINQRISQMYIWCYSGMKSMKYAASMTCDTTSKFKYNSQNFKKRCIFSKQHNGNKDCFLSINNLDKWGCLSSTKCQFIERFKRYYIAEKNRFSIHLQLVVQLSPWPITPVTDCPRLQARSLKK